MLKEMYYYGKVKTAKGEGKFIFTLRVLTNFIRTQKFIELTITKKKPKKK